MSKARNPRHQSNYFQTTVQKILSSTTRSRLAAFLILVALAATAVYTVTSRAQRSAPKQTAGRVQEGKSEREREREREREKRAAQDKGSKTGRVLTSSDSFVEVDNRSEAAEEAEEAREEAQERLAELRDSLTPQQKEEASVAQAERLRQHTASFKVNRNPQMQRLVKARSFTGDLRQLPQTRPEQRDRAEREVAPPFFVGDDAPVGSGMAEPERSVPAPTPSTTFLGLDFANWGAGRPPDTVGDVGPTYYIQSVNTSIGIYRKSDNVRVAAFTYDTFMSQGNFGNLCDTENFGDPVILYDTFEDRWIITDFAFTIDGAGNVNSSAAYQCFAASKTGDPVTGGWNFYSINSTTLLGDYPKFGIWPDGLYMSANMFGFPASAGFSKAQLWAFNKHQMYAGNPNVQIVTFDAPAGEFSLLPSNARLQAGTPPTGTPNLFSVVWQFANVFTVYKFHVDWNNTSLSTLTGPFNSVAPASFQTPPATVPAQGGNNNDTLGHRLQMQNQYTNQGGVESLWNVHTVRGAVSTRSSIRYYQVGVTGGTIGASPLQAATFTPDTQNRYMPSLAVDRAGNMAVGYSVSSATLFPAIRYAGRLSTDPVNTLAQTETSMIEGTGSQNTSTRWGDYSAMTLDPDGCTFWYTTEYYITTGGNWQTRIGKFKYPQCTPLGGGGTVQGTVTATGTGDPVVGATVSLGSRVMLTDANGFYQFTNIPAGTYPYITVSYPGYVSQTVNNVVVTDGGTTVQNFALVLAPPGACLVDTTQADFSGGALTNLDITTSPGNVTLTNAPSVDQQNTNITSSGFTFNATNWGGQTFVAGVTAPLVSADVALFCSACTGTTPNITLSVRATSAGLPTGADLATATIPGFNSGTTSYRTGTFTTPLNVTAGTQYALIIRPVSNPSAGSYVYLVSAAATAYTNGSEVFSGNSGATWAADVDDLGFHTFMNTGYRSSGTLISSLKDANPAVGVTAKWTTISWNATTPASTNITFQVAASNNPAGPFNFVGPDGTAGTFFTNGGSLAQFNGNRYLKYKAVFTTSNSAVTPTLADVTICYQNTQATTLTVAPAVGTYGGTTTLSATLTDGTNPLSGKTVKFKLNGANFAGNTAVTNASGVATLSNVPLTGINAGTYPTGVFASFAGDATYSPSNGTNSLTVNKASTSTSVTSNNNPSAGGEPVTFTATVTSAGGTPTGTVTFKDGVTSLGNGNLNGSGQATLTTSSLSQGSHSITAEYNGDTNFNTSVSPAITQVVTEPLSACANVAEDVYGSTATASSTFGPGYPPGGAIDGNHTGAGWGTGVGWNDNTPNAYPDTLTINLGTSRQINEIYVYSLQDNYLSPTEPTESMTFTTYGLVDFQVQVPDGVGGWMDVPGGNITGNNKVRRRIIFASAVTTDQIRIVVNNTSDNLWSRVVEVEAFSCNAGPPPTPTPTPTPCTTNVAASSYGGSASASSTIGPNYPASGVIDGNRAATNWGTGTGWNDATAGVYPDSVVLNFGVNQAISEVDVYSLQDNYTSPVEPTDVMTFNYYGLTDFQVQIPDGVGGWVDVPGGHVTGNNLVKRKVVFAPVVTSQIRVLVNSSADGVYSRIAEVEAFSCSAVPGPTPTPTPTPCTTNVAASSYGATASASSTVSPNYPASGAIDGNHTGAGWGTGVGWNDATAGVYPDNLVVNLNAMQAISEVDVYSLQDNYTSPIEPTNTTTFTFYGLTNFQVQYWNGAAFVDVPGGVITGNNLVKRKVVFASPVVTDQIRILVNSTADGVYSRIVEVEAFSCTPVVVSAPNKRSGSSADVILTGYGQNPSNPARLPLPLRLLSPSLNRAWLR
jgi:hypothetical protein